jgi:hypothetical protein
MKKNKKVFDGVNQLLHLAVIRSGTVSLNVLRKRKVLSAVYVLIAVSWSGSADGLWNNANSKLPVTNYSTGTVNERAITCGMSELFVMRPN